MAFYDSTAMCDSGLRYDFAPPITRPRKMIQLKLDLQSKSDAQLKEFALNHISMMTGNAAFPDPLPDAPEFLLITNDFGTSLNEFNGAQTTAMEKTSAKDAKRLALETALGQRASNIIGKPGVTETEVLSTGFQIRAARTPAGPTSQVMNLALSAGDSAGEIDAQWDPNGAKSYLVQTSPDPMTPTSWTSQPSVTKSKAVILGLQSGTRVWVRVRAVGPSGEGPWSDPATKIVP